MADHEIEITPDTTVHELLETYPELEEKLIAMAPPFANLNNPLLRKSVAKIATLRHISSVGDIPLNDLVNTIRMEVGQAASAETYQDEDYFSAQPDWFSADKVAITLVEKELGDDGKMAVVAVLREAKNINPGEIIELTTTFLPAPAIDAVKSKGYWVWTMRGEGDAVHTYFMKE